MLESASAFALCSRAEGGPVWSQLWFAPPPDGTDIGARFEGYAAAAEGAPRTALVHSRGLLLAGADGATLNVRQLRLEDGRTIKASDLLAATASEKLSGAGEEKELRDLSDAEKAAIEKLRDKCAGVLGVERAAVRPTTHLFRAGLSSMDVVRLIEEVREACGGTDLTADDVYAAPLFSELSQCLIHRFAHDSSCLLIGLSEWSFYS